MKTQREFDEDLEEFITYTRKLLGEVTLILLGFVIVVSAAAVLLGGK